MMTGPGPEPGLGELSMMRRAGLAAGAATALAGAFAATFAVAAAGLPLTLVTGAFAADTAGRAAFFAAGAAAMDRLGDAVATTLPLGFVDFFSAFLATGPHAPFAEMSPKRSLTVRQPRKTGIEP